MATAKPLKAGSTGAEQFTSTDTLPPANLPVMVGDSGSGGTQGAVPAPASGDATAGKFLKANGTWAAPPSGSTPSVITPSQITTDQDDYAPTGWADCTTARISFDSDINAITGLAAATDGERKILRNVGSYFGYLPCDHPDSTAANRITGNADIMVAPGGNIEVEYDGTLNRWVLLRNSYNPAVDIRGHFYSMTAASNQNAQQSDLTFTGTVDIVAGTSTLPGAFQLETLTSATGVASMYFADSLLNPTYYGAAHIDTAQYVYFQTLSNGTQTYTYQFGIVPTPSSTTLAVNNSIGIRYSHGINSGKFEGFTRNTSGTESTVDLGTTVAANTNYKLRVSIDKSIGEVRFYVNDAYAGRVTTNLPSAVAVGSRAIIVKSVGTTDRTALIARYTFTTTY